MKNDILAFFIGIILLVLIIAGLIVTDGELIAVLILLLAICAMLFLAYILASLILLLFGIRTSMTEYWEI